MTLPSSLRNGLWRNRHDSVHAIFGLTINPLGNEVGHEPLVAMPLNYSERDPFPRRGPRRNVRWYCQVANRSARISWTRPATNRPSAVTTAASPARLLYVDALRGVAATGVMLFHFSGHRICGELNQQLPDCHSLGTCDMANWVCRSSFVISGFVIAYSVRGYQMSGRFLGRFALRRSVRLDPPYWFTIAAVIATELPVEDTIWATATSSCPPWVRSWRTCSTSTRSWDTTTFIPSSGHCATKSNSTCFSSCCWASDSDSVASR